MKQIFIDVRVNETRVAVKEDDELVELYFERPIKENLVGNIYVGRICSVLPGMQACFVDIGYERNAFLYFADAVPRKKGRAALGKNIRNMLKPGQEVAVQVTKESIGAKGPKVTTHLTLPGKYFVLTPTNANTGISLKIEDYEERERLRTISEKLTNGKSGVIIRTDAANKSRKDLTKDLKKLFSLWQEVENNIQKKEKVPRCVYREKNIAFKSIRDLFSQDVDKLIINDAITYSEMKNYLREMVPQYISKLMLDEDIDIFDKYGIEPYISKAAENRVWLKCGGYLVIDRTEALTVIDVNTGKYIGKSSLEETVTTVNCQAAREIARQLRLRDISGIIIIDFIDMQNEGNREKMLSMLKQELKKDRTKTNIAGMTSLGLIELTRKKTRQPLDKSILVECPGCGGTGRVFSPLFIAAGIEKKIEKIASEHQGRHSVLLNDEMAGLFQNELRANISEIEEKWNSEIDIKSSKELKPDEMIILEGED